jgi:hypothetical protein
MSSGGEVSVDWDAMNGIKFIFSRANPTTERVLRNNFDIPSAVNTLISLS